MRSHLIGFILVILGIIIAVMCILYVAFALHTVVGMLVISIMIIILGKQLCDNL